MNVLEIVIKFLNTPAGYALAGFIILFVINKIFDVKPGWAKYEGWMISGVKWAEKLIDDDSENPHLAKADAALKYFIAAYTNAKGKKPSQKLIAHVELGLPIIHDKLEHMMKRKEEVKKNLAA